MFALIVTIGFAWAYFATTISEYSITDFFRWYVEMFKALQADISDEPIIPYLIMIILPLIAYIGFIGSIISRQNALNAMKSKLNLKSVDFLQDRVKFNFNQSQYNFVCGYSDINNLEMNLNTVMVRTKSGSYPAVSEVKLYFTVLKNKHFTLSNTPLNLTNFIYKIIDYGRAVQNFSYRFGGVGTVEAIEERIKDYMNVGCKQILTNRQETVFKWLSVVFFAIGMFFLFTFQEDLNSTDTMIWALLGVPIIGFFVPSFIFDIVLLADKWNENRYKGLRK